jgi:hypothetical protein
MKECPGSRKTRSRPPSRSLGALRSTHLLVRKNVLSDPDREDHALRRRSGAEIMQVMDAKIILPAIARKFNIWYQHSHS